MHTGTPSRLTCGYPRGFHHLAGGDDKAGEPKGKSTGSRGSFPTASPALLPHLSCTNAAVGKQVPTPRHTTGDLRNPGRPAHSLSPSPTVQSASSQLGVPGYGGRCVVVSWSRSHGPNAPLRVQVHKVRQPRGEPVVTVVKGGSRLGKMLGKLPASLVPPTRRAASTGRPPADPPFRANSGLR
jgi:hypothetical protein